MWWIIYKIAVLLLELGIISLSDIYKYVQNLLNYAISQLELGHLDAENYGLYFESISTFLNKIFPLKKYLIKILNNKSKYQNIKIRNNFFQNSILSFKVKETILLSQTIYLCIEFLLWLWNKWLCKLTFEILYLFSNIFR